jgi:hypothetical protein
MMNRHKNIGLLDKMVRILLIQVFFFTQFNFSDISSAVNYENSLRRTRTSEMTVEETTEVDELTQNLILISNALSVQIDEWLEGSIAGVDFERDGYVVGSLADSLADLAISYGVEHQELADLTKMVIDNFDTIYPGLDNLLLLGVPTNAAYITPWVRVAVEAAIREGTTDVAEIKGIIDELRGALSQAEVINDAAVILGIESSDVNMTDPAIFYEFVEYARIVVVQSKIDQILKEELGEEGVLKYQSSLGSVIQVANWLQASTQDVLDSFREVVSGISEIEVAVKGLTGSDSADFVTPWIMAALMEDLENNFTQEDLISRVTKLIEVSNNADLQEEAAVGLAKEEIDFTSHDDVVYLSLQAKAVIEQELFLDKLKEAGVGSDATREQLATNLYFLSLVFNKQGKDEMVSLARDSFSNIESMLDEIGKLADRDGITIDDAEVLPWVWLDMVLSLDQEVDLTVESVLRFANTEEGQYVLNTLLDGEFDPTDISHISLLAPLSQMISGSKVETQAPITSEELDAILANERVNSLINEAVTRSEDLYAGQTIDIERVKKALLFQVLKGDRASWGSYDWKASGLIDGLTDSEIAMAETARLLLADEAKFSICSDSIDAIRNLRTESIDRALPDAFTTPQGFGWKSKLYRAAATVLAAGVATGVFLAGDRMGSSMMFKAWLGFMTYCNVKPIVELGITGLVDIFMPHKPLAEVQSIRDQGIPQEHSGIIFRQMIVLDEGQLSEKTLIEEWLKQRLKFEKGREYTIENGAYVEAWAAQGGGEENIKLAIILDFNDDAEGQRLRQLAVERYSELVEKYPGLDDNAFLLIRNRGNWQYEEAYNRKEGRIDDGLAFLYKGINYADTHLEGDMADLRARDRDGNIKILGDNFYIDANTGQLMYSDGRVVQDSNGNIVTEEAIDFTYVYFIEGDNLRNAYGDVIESGNNFIVNEAEGYIEFKNTPYSTITVHAENEKADMIEGGYGKLRFIVKDGMLYEMVNGVDEAGNSRFELQLIDSNPQFVGDEGRIMVNKNTSEIIRLENGNMIRGNYIGLDLRRDPFEPLFSYIGGNVEELGIVVDENGNITGVDEENRMKYFFVVDEDTTLPSGSVLRMIAKFAHPDNAEYVIMQPALKNTNAYTSWFTRIDTLARGMLRFSEFTNWSIFGGVMYGKWGARVDDYYHQIVEKEIADPTARSEDERPTLAVPVVGLSDVFWGDEPKKTFYQFMARLKEWTIGDEQTLLKQYVPRMLWGVPYKIYASLTGKEVQDLPKLSAQGQRMLTNLGRSITLPTAFATLLTSYFVAGTVPGLYAITGRTVSNAITTAIVLGTIMFIGKWLAPTVRDIRTAGFARSNEEGLRALAADWGNNLGNYAGIATNNAGTAITEFIWSTGLFIPFIWLKSKLNWEAYREIRQADRESRMVPRTAGVTIANTNKIENLIASYVKLLPSPVAGALAIADLAIVNPMALLGFIPIGFAFLFQPTLAYWAENTTEDFRKSIITVEDNNADFAQIGVIFRDLYKDVADETMANEQLERLYRLTAGRLQRYFGIGGYRNTDTVWNSLTADEREALTAALGDNAESTFSSYLDAIYDEMSIRERKAIESSEEKLAYLDALYVRAEANGIIARNIENANKPNLVSAAKEIFNLMDNVDNLGGLNQDWWNDFIIRHSLSSKDQSEFKKLYELAQE